MLYYNIYAGHGVSLCFRWLFNLKLMSCPPPGQAPTIKSPIPTGITFYAGCRKAYHNSYVISGLANIHLESPSNFHVICSKPLYALIIFSCFMLREQPEPEIVIMKNTGPHPTPAPPITPPTSVPTNPHPNNSWRQTTAFHSKRTSAAAAHTASSAPLFPHPRSHPGYPS